jgi:hypothetical protein
MADQLMPGGDPDIDFNFARSADVTSSDEHTTGLDSSLSCSQCWMFVLRVVHVTSHKQTWVMDTSRVLSEKTGDDYRTQQAQFDDVDDHPKTELYSLCRMIKVLCDPSPM